MKKIIKNKYSLRKTVTNLITFVLSVYLLVIVFVVLFKVLSTLIGFYGNIGSIAESLVRISYSCR